MTMDGSPSVRRMRLLYSAMLTAFVLAGVAVAFHGFSDRPLLADETAPEPASAPKDPNEAARRELERYQDPNPYPFPPDMVDVRLLEQTAEEAEAKSASCAHCHQGTRDPHFKSSLHIGCTDCHGGDATSFEKDQSHVAPKYPEAWRTAANPIRSYTLLNQESPAFVRFVNPGDLRIAHISCGTAGCHPQQTLQVRKSMMTHGAMLWGAALYNNGSVPFKWPRYGEAYSMDGKPVRLQTVPAPTLEEIERGVLPFLEPLPRFEASQPGNVLRIFERGGRFRPEIGIPERLEEPGRPRERISDRGLGTQNRTDPVFIGLQKTRLFDPTLNFLGTNDHPGDYRSSGCTACHVIYANDGDVMHSGPYHIYGHQGKTSPDNPDPTIPKDESGHPIKHQFLVGIPSSQCMVCHIHPGTTVMNSYFGYMWWDMETDGQHMYPRQQRYPTAEQYVQSMIQDPNEIAARGLWSNPEFLDHSHELNSEMSQTQFAQFHGHGWMFRAVFKKDKEGRLLDHEGKVVPEVTPALLEEAVAPPDKERLADGLAKDYQCGVPVHLRDIHLERGMHCVDCHFVQDAHGDARLYGEVRAAIEIQCIDCHGTPTRLATLRTTGPAAAHSIEAGVAPGRDLARMRTPFGKPRFERQGEKIVQNSMVTRNLDWEVTQTMHTMIPGHPKYNEKSHFSKTVTHSPDGKGMVWGAVPKDGKLRWDATEEGKALFGDAAVMGEEQCPHNDTNMSCIACHSSWNPSCYGCHLPQKANRKMPNLHNEGDVSRNYVSYNFQTLRDEVYMLARDGNATNNRVNPARSSCAIHVTSFNQNREQIYVQQQTISGEGLSGIAFSTNVPHTVRPGTGGVTSEQKMCTDCHLSKANDNNAQMAQLMMLGTGYLNFMGRFCWVAGGEEGLFGVAVTELEEPQSVIGSTMHKLVYPDNYAKHRKRDKHLKTAHEHPGKDILENITRPFQKPEVLDVQLRGEYLYAACGAAGVKVFDVAFIDDKAFSERITTAPVSPLGQRFFVRTAYATSIAAPVTTAPDPTRTHYPENHEAPVHALYGYLYITDKHEGLILVGAGTLLDGIPTNNFLKRDLTYNPDGILNGARAVKIIGEYAYICCDAGLVVVSIDDPMHPEVTCVLGPDQLVGPKSLDAQFRYAFVCDEEGLKVLDITELATPRLVAELPLVEAHNVYLARTRAYVAGGHQGMVIIDVTNPETPKIEQVFDEEGEMNDVHDIQLGITYNSLFAYVADGHNGLKVVQLSSPMTPGNEGFSPRPTPHVIAHFEFEHGGEALAVTRAVDRDRAVDESGNQTSVFGRVGARPFNLDEQRKLFLKSSDLYRVSNNPNDADLYRYVGPERTARQEG